MATLTSDMTAPSSHDAAICPSKSPATLEDCPEIEKSHVSLEQPSALISSVQDHDVEESIVEEVNNESVKQEEVAVKQATDECNEGAQSVALDEVATDSPDAAKEMTNGDDEDDDEFHEAIDGDGVLLDCETLVQDKPAVPPTLSFSINEMEVITNRGGRSGSLSKFLDDTDTYRRRSLPSYPEDQLFAGSPSQKKMTLAAFLDMQIDPVLEILEDTDSDIRHWLMQPETVQEVLAEFVTPPVFSGEPHEEYGYYKKHFLCSEIIMKLYTGEEDLYESFSSDSSAGSSMTSAVFGCQEEDDIAKWEQLYAIFNNPIPLDEMQLLFFSKALVRLHDGFCLEEGYVNNILKRFLPLVVPHFYSNTIKYMLTLILQSYESVHPITGRNDAMEIAAPLLAKATRIDLSMPENLPLVENTTNLLVDMLQANQADRLGAFCRREGGVYLSKYFVRDQFGTIRGFESMTHGYHNFLQYMLLEEMSKQPTIVEELFRNASHELAVIQEHKITEVSSVLTVHVVTELLIHCQKLLNENVESEENNQTPETEAQNVQMFGYSSFPADQYPNSPHEGTNEAAMYNLASLPQGHALWMNVLDIARQSCGSFVKLLNAGLPSSAEISLAKYLSNLVLLNDTKVNEELHQHGLIQLYLEILEKRSSFDMLIIHIVPAISFILRDAEAIRAKNCPLTKDLFGVDVNTSDNIISLLLRAKMDIPSLEIYAAILHDVIDEVFTSKAPSQNNTQVIFFCKRNPGWAKLSGNTRLSSGSDKSTRTSLLEENRNSINEQSTRKSEQKVLEASETCATTDLTSYSSDEPENVSNSRKSSVSKDIEEQDSESSAVDPDTNQDVAVVEEDESVDKQNLHLTELSASSSPQDSAQEDLPKEDFIEIPETNRNSEGDGSRKSHYFKNVLQSPVFKSPMRLGSVIKPPVVSAQDPSSSTENQHRNSFGWNSVFKRLRKSLVTIQNDKTEKKVLALSNEAYVSPNVAPRQTDVLVVDTSHGEDITTFVARDAGVQVIDVPAASKAPETAVNVITAGYMYKNKWPETGNRNVWERYFFVLNRSEGLLSYYISEAHAKDRTFVRGSSRPLSVSEGLPMHVHGQKNVVGFQINTQGHGAFMVLVDSIDTRLTWLTEILVCVSNATQSLPLPRQRLSLVSDDVPSIPSSLKCNKKEMKQLVEDFYRNLFGPNLKFSSPLDAPASFWMEEKIDPVSDGCVLSSNLPDCVPYWGEFHGYKRLCDYWKIRDETVERSSGRVLRIVVDEDEETVVVMTSTTFRILRNSEILTEESCDIVSVSGCSIVSIHCTFDSYRIAQAFKKEGISAS